jgi:hypothetical protein
MHPSLATIIGQALSLPASTIHITPRPALDHQSNQLYDVWLNGRHCILKEFLKPEEQAIAPVREYGALERLASLDIAPQPVFYDPALGPYVLYEFMAGEMWDRRRPVPSELARLADLWLQVNAISAEGLPMSRGYEQPLAAAAARFAAAFQSYAAWAEAEFKPGQRAAEWCLRILDDRRDIGRQLDQLTPVFCFCKSDQRFANVIQRPDGRLGLIDWEDSGLRDPARDLADLVTASNQEDLLSFDEWQPFLQPYLAARSQHDQALIERMQLYLAVFPIFWLAIFANLGVQRVQSGQLSGWTANRMPINFRLRRYLARALAWPAMDFTVQLETLADIEFFPTYDHKP